MNEETVDLAPSLLRLQRALGRIVCRAEALATDGEGPADMGRLKAEADLVSLAARTAERIAEMTRAASQETPATNALTEPERRRLRARVEAWIDERAETRRRARPPAPDARPDPATAEPEAPPASAAQPTEAEHAAPASAADGGDRSSVSEPPATAPPASAVRDGEGERQDAAPAAIAAPASAGHGGQGERPEAEHAAPASAADGGDRSSVSEPPATAPPASAVRDGEGERQDAAPAAIAAPASPRAGRANDRKRNTPRPPPPRTAATVPPSRAPRNRRTGLRRARREGERQDAAPAAIAAPDSAGHGLAGESGRDVVRTHFGPVRQPVGGRAVDPAEPSRRAPACDDRAAAGRDATAVRAESDGSSCPRRARPPPRGGEAAPQHDTRHAFPARAAPPPDLSP